MEVKARGEIPDFTVKCQIPVPWNSGRKSHWVAWRESLHMQ